MWPRDMKWANSFGKMASIHLLNSELQQIFNFIKQNKEKKPQCLWSTINLLHNEICLCLLSAPLVAFISLNIQAPINSVFKNYRYIFFTLRKTWVYLKFLFFWSYAFSFGWIISIHNKMVLEDMFKISNYCYVLLMTFKKATVHRVGCIGNLM